MLLDYKYALKIEAKYLLDWLWNVRIDLTWTEMGKRVEQGLGRKTGVQFWTLCI